MVGRAKEELGEEECTRVTEVAVAVVAVVGGVSVMGEWAGDLDLVLVGEGLVTGVVCCESNPESLEDRSWRGEGMMLSKFSQTQLHVSVYKLVHILVYMYMYMHARTHARTHTHTHTHTQLTPL